MKAEVGILESCLSAVRRRNWWKTRIRGGGIWMILFREKDDASLSSQVALRIERKRER